MFRNKFGNIAVKRHPIFAVAIALALVMFVATDGVVSAASKPPKAPENFTASATRVAGEILVRWDPEPGATAYELCIESDNDEKVCDVINPSVTGRFYGNLDVGVRYWFAIRSYRDPWASMWFFTERIRAGTENFCPITGFPMPAGGYNSIGDTVRANGVSVTVDSVSFPADTDKQLANDRRFIKICVTVHGRNRPSITPNLDTDAGLSTRWYNQGICGSYDIPANATVAVFTVLPWNKKSREGPPFLYRFDVPAD